MIEVSHLSKSFGTKKVLDKISIKVKEGSIYGLVGPNGAGKTTLLKHLAGIYRQDEGEVRVMGQICFENSDVKKEVAFISDELYYYPQYRVRDMAHFCREVYESWDEGRYQDLKELFNISEDLKISRMSKGMKKQLAFWLAISHKPKVLILDEPLDGLDPIARKKILGVLMEDVAKNKTTILVSSHNLRELEDICDTVGILHKGHVIIEKELDNLKASVYKIQVAFDEKTDVVELLKEMKILYQDKIGSVYTFILKGDKEYMQQRIEEVKPIIFDMLPLSLEEVFIYEVREAGYETEETIL